MADTCRFSQQTLGDQATSWVVRNAPLTPPAMQAGIWRDAGGLSTESRNMMRTLEVTVTLKRTTSFALSAAVDAIQSWQGRRGEVQIRSGGAVKIRSTDDQWTLERVELSGVDPGFGGRWVRDLLLRFVGSSPLEYS
ncbi:MAG: hypothetical protein U1A27_00060 [Phycisphaerae bacterium]